MGVDYYDLLKVPKTAAEEELRRAYKRLAMRWHPDKHPTTTQAIAEAKFKQICEAYDILSNAQTRQIYDLYGEEGLKYSVSSPSSAAGRRGNSAKGKDAGDMFDDFFGDFGSDAGSDKGRSPKSENVNRPAKAAEGMKAAPVENRLACSLEELYKGSKRKMKISRILSDDSGNPRSVEEVLGIDIKPGWKKGTKITFPEKGNQEAGLLPGDLIFVIDEKPHPTFKRDGNDLVIQHKLSLLDALTGKSLNFYTLDGRNLSMEVSDIVKPGHELVIPDEGMPISKEPKKRGNLRIKFDVKFPSRLSSDQKADLKQNISQEYGIETTPTFLFMKRGKLLAKVNGALRRNFKE